MSFYTQAKETLKKVGAEVTEENIEAILEAMYAMHEWDMEREKKKGGETNMSEEQIKREAFNDANYLLTLYSNFADSKCDELYEKHAKPFGLSKEEWTKYMYNFRISEFEEWLLSLNKKGYRVQIYRGEKRVMSVDVPGGYRWVCECDDNEKNEKGDE